MSDLPSPPKLSSELFVVPLEGGRYLVYAPLRRTAFVANAASVNCLDDLRRRRFDGHDEPERALADLLRALDLVDAGEVRAPITRFEGDPEPTAVTLFLTTACNLRCTYCYASAGDTPLEHMPLEVATRGIDFVSRNAKKKGVRTFDVAYHGGGEPTAHWKVLTESFAYAKARADALGLELRAGTATNGVLSDAHIDWIVTHLHRASVSFDGLPEVHDRHRLTVLGRGSSARVMHTLRRFDQARFSYGVRVTVTADAIGRLPESIAFLCARSRVRDILVEPAYRLGRWSDAPFSETEDFLAAFRAAREHARAHGRELRFSAVRIDTLTNHFCGVTRDGFCLTPSGHVSGCYEVFSKRDPRADTFVYGEEDPRGGYRFRLPVLNELRGRAVQHRDYCRGCFAKWHCAGDCHHKSIAEGGDGDGDFKGSPRCHIIRELTKDAILDRIAAAGGLVWRGGAIAGNERGTR